MSLVALAAALTAGVAGSAHCTVMCGAVAAALGGTGANRKLGAAAASAVGFNVGRILGYALVGASLEVAVGLLGAGLPGPGYALVVRALAALWMGALALRILSGRDVLAIGRVGAWVWRHIAPLAGPAMRLPQPYRSVCLGLLWGFMPCGLVYSVLLVAAASPSAGEAAALMAAFGLGTMPALVGIGTASVLGFAQLAKSAPLRRVAGVVVLACGLVTGWGALAAATGPEHGLGTTTCADGTPPR